MKILIISSTLHGGGVQRAVSNISMGLSEKDIELDIVLNSTSKADLPHGGRIHSLNMPIDAESDIWYQFRVFLKRLFFIRKMKKTGQYDICLSFMESANIVNILTGNKKCKVAISVRSYISLRKSFQYKYIASPLMRILYNRADKIIAISQGVADDLINKYNVNSNLIQTVYNIFDIRELQNESKGESKYFKRDDSKFYFMASGRNVRPKGQWHLIRAFSEVVKFHPEARLIIIGTGKLKGYYEKLIEGYRLQNKVYLLGFVDEPFRIAGQCDVFVFPSLWEGFGNVLVENMACGLPVIASDFRAGAREVLAPDTDYRFEQKEKIEFAENGVIVPVCSGIEYSYKEPLEKQEKIMSEAMCRMLTDGTLREHYRKKSVARAKDFSKDIIINDWIKVLNMIADERRPS